MSLKRFLTAAAATLFIACTAPSVQAGKYDVLEENIKVAQEKFIEAKEQLKKKAGTLFGLFMNAPDINVRHAAEVEIKSRFREEYDNYIQAAIDLDDAEYAIYIAGINAVTNDIATD